jgi:hypothetical protein
MNINANPAALFLKFSPMSPLTVILLPAKSAGALSWIRCFQQHRYQRCLNARQEKPAAAGMSSAAARRTGKAAVLDNNKASGVY